MNDDRHMQLGVLPEQGGSIANLRRVGQDTRFVEQYLRLYVREFEEVHYYSYAREQLPQPLADNFHLHGNPGLHRWLYAFLLPLIHARTLRRCSVLRVMQATGAIPARLARLLFGVPFVVTYGYHYSTDFRAEGRRFRAWLFDRRAEFALRSADGVIVTTPALREFVARFVPAGRIALIPNSVDTKLFAATPTEKSPSSRRHLIAVGGLTPNKNHRLILEAMALSGRDDLELVVLGKGTEEEALRRLAAEKKLALELPGIVPNDALPDWLRRADVYLITSLSEGHPKSLLEAMSVGLPCIGTDVRGIRDVIASGKTGWLVPPEAGALAATVHAVLSDRAAAQAIGDAARRYILENHDAAVVMAREVAFLKTAARKRL